ncbi:MAG TPA: ABC transporter permease [Herpetosiphonaceae bacterium]
MIAALRYLRDRWPEVQELLIQHLQITAGALALALLIALPLGIALARRPRLAVGVMSFLGILYTIPSLALLVFFIPILGLGFKTAVVTLVIYAQIVLVRNIVAGLQAINPALIEAARGMGMNAWQRWWRVEFPLALPIILAGVRIAAIMIIGIAAIAAKINAGGLGKLLFDGIAGLRDDKILAGALVVGLLAIAINGLFLLIERLVDPEAKIRRSQRRATPAHPPQS